MTGSMIAGPAQASSATNSSMGVVREEGGPHPPVEGAAPASPARRSIQSFNSDGGEISIDYIVVGYYI